VAHVFERAPSGRSKCRGCGAPIDKASLRFGERLPNLYGEGEMTLWFHPPCAAYKRPEPLLEALAEASEPIERSEWLESRARASLAHHRLPRASGAERAPSGRARCRSCESPIAKGLWRIPLVWFEQGMFSPAGFIHAGCAPAYLGATDIVERLAHFSPELTPADLRELEAAVAASER
jgi:hypothetical protein